MLVKYGFVFVDDQDKALRFYTEKLGFRKVTDAPDPVDGGRLVTIASPDGVEGFEWVLCAAATPEARRFQQEFFNNEYAFHGFSTPDIHRDYQVLKARGVQFIDVPFDAGPVWTVKFDDTCGNLVNMLQEK